MAGFSRSPKRTSTIVVRLTDKQKETIGRLVESLALRGQADVVRLALDYFVEHSPAAKAAMKKSVRS